jgi:hypothetical protein
VGSRVAGASWNAITCTVGKGWSTLSEAADFWVKDIADAEAEFYHQENEKELAKVATKASERVCELVGAEMNVNNPNKNKNSNNDNREDDSQKLQAAVTCEATVFSRPVPIHDQSNDTFIHADESSSLPTAIVRSTITDTDITHIGSQPSHRSNDGDHLVDATNKEMQYDDNGDDGIFCQPADSTLNVKEGETTMKESSSWLDLRAKEEGDKEDDDWEYVESEVHDDDEEF